MLKAAREVTADGKMSAASFAALSAAMPKEQVVDLTVTMSFYNAVVRILASFEIDVEPDYQKYLDKYPLPKA